jgi:hypothetical protein
LLLLLNAGALTLALPQLNSVNKSAEIKNIFEQDIIMGIFLPLLTMTNRISALKKCFLPEKRRKHFNSLMMAGNTAFVVGSAVAAIAAGGIKFAFNLVHGYEIATMLKFTIRAITVSGRWFHFYFIGVAVITEGAFMAGGAESVI